MTELNTVATNVAVDEPNQENGSGRGSNGKFVKGNQAARRTGVYARIQPAKFRMTADTLMSGVVQDLGGHSELSTLQRSYARKLGDLEITLRLLTSDIAQHGLMTPGGRVRGSYDKLLAGLATFDRYAQRLGLERRQKRVNTPEQWLAAQVADPEGEDETAEEVV